MPLDAATQILENDKKRKISKNNTLKCLPSFYFNTVNCLRGTDSPLLLVCVVSLSGLKSNRGNDQSETSQVSGDGGCPM